MGCMSYWYTQMHNLASLIISLINIIYSAGDLHFIAGSKGLCVMHLSSHVLKILHFSGFS
jgi:hypothetical protein